jgi:hypothetical protein
MDWRGILDLPDAVTVDDVIARHRCLAKKHHPDLGGSVAMMQEINAAKIAAIDELTGKSELNFGLGPMVNCPKRRRRRRRKL